MGCRKKISEVVKKGARKGQSVEGVAPSSALVRAEASGQREEEQEFELQVVLPFSDSGINLLLDKNGVEDRVSEGEEVAKLMGIQRKVGFTFEGREQNVKKKLVELEKVDRAKNVVRVSEMGL
ncbi:hypothetical protein P8452_17453 [Trifolium repens]|jgi:hypothetical protein|nr:hypothetical protein P8452_17453 [Trifolium repens]